MRQSTKGMLCLTLRGEMAQSCDACSALAKEFCYRMSNDLSEAWSSNGSSCASI